MCVIKSELLFAYKLMTIMAELHVSFKVFSVRSHYSMVSYCIGKIAIKTDSYRNM